MKVDPSFFAHFLSIKEDLYSLTLGGKQMLEIRLDEAKVEEMLLDEIEQRIKQLEKRYTFWDLDELCKQTCMSLGNIKDKFFYDPRFPKHKIGGKWYVPAKECETFLLAWIKEQPRQ